MVNISELFRKLIEESDESDVIFCGITEDNIEQASRCFSLVTGFPQESVYVTLDGVMDFGVVRCIATHEGKTQKGTFAFTDSPNNRGGSVTIRELEDGGIWKHTEYQIYDVASGAPRIEKEVYYFTEDASGKVTANREQ